MFKEKPIISNQYGALVMAFVPFLYAIFSSEFIFEHIWFALSWLFLYLFSYPFFAIFSKKNKSKYLKWAIIYASISICFAIPILLFRFSVLQFFIPLLPFVLIQIYYTKQKNERHLINDIAGILIFGIVGMASFYLTTEKYNFEILIHPTLFFIATTFYIKSVARERKNPFYLKLSISSHILLGIIYLALDYYTIAFAYLVGLVRAIILPKKKLNIKQIGLLEFIIVFIFTLALIFGAVLDND